MSRNIKLGDTVLLWINSWR